jgi:hypothetical protein
MSAQSEITALSLHEILLSISDSLNEAQEQLRNMPPYDAYGRPNTLYQLPYLDFSLEVLSEARVAETTTGNVAQPVETGKTLKGAQLPLQAQPSFQKLVFSPTKPQTQTLSQSSHKITSTISGRFVAILPNNGLPQVFLTLTSEAIPNTTKYIIKAKLLLATNEAVVGQKVELNFDKDNSLAISNKTVLAANPQFVPAKEGITNSEGIFSTEINLAGAMANETYIIVANTGTIFSSMAISK